MPLNPETQITCPYNKAHVMVLSRMQFHLIKCRAQHPNAEKAICPFNSTHVIAKVEMPWHLDWCNSRITGEREFIKIGSESNERPFTQNLPAAPAIIQGEVWDEEDVTTGESVLDKVREEAYSKPTLHNKICAPKAERKQHRLQERRRFIEVLGNTSPSQGNNDNASGSSSRGAVEEPAPRPQPQQQPQPIKLDVSIKKAPSPRSEAPGREGATEEKKPSGPWTGWKTNTQPPLEQQMTGLQIGGSGGGGAERRAPMVGTGPQRDPSNPWAARGPVLADPSPQADFPSLPVSGRGRQIRR